MKYFLTILVILLVVTNMFWLYNALDKGMTADHSRSAQTQATKSIETLLLLNNLFSLGQGYESVSANLESKLNSSLIKNKSNAIFVDSVVLIFENRSLSAVKLLNDLTSKEYTELEK